MGRQYGVIDRREALRSGMTPEQIRYRLETGEWEALHIGVYRMTTLSKSPHQALIAACLGAGPFAVASHQSAAWMWNMLRHPPNHPTISVPWPVRARLTGVTVHQSRDLDPARTLERRRIPCTDPLRVATDLAASLPTNELIQVVDSAIAGRLISTQGLIDEINRRAARGRPGPAALRRMLRDRGIIGGPDPSVLESMAMRMFKRCGIPVMKREVHFGPDGQFRIDFMIAPGLLVEVDGFVHHWSPEAKAYDEARRNQLRLEGLFLLVYTWRDIRFESRRVGREVASARIRYAA
jgi:hypothetical protein